MSRWRQTNRLKNSLRFCIVACNVHARVRARTNMHSSADLSFVPFGEHTRRSNSSFSCQKRKTKSEIFGSAKYGLIGQLVSINWFLIQLTKHRIRLRHSRFKLFRREWVMKILAKIMTQDFRFFFVVVANSGFPTVLFLFEFRIDRNDLAAAIN